jgi:hypothetical protein
MRGRRRPTHGGRTPRPLTGDRRPDTLPSLLVVGGARLRDGPYLAMAAFAVAHGRTNRSGERPGAVVLLQDVGGALGVEPEVSQQA